MPDRPSPPAECANCGAAIPRSAQACPACGADERTGWRDSTATLYDGLDLPDSAYADEAAPPAPRPRRGPAWYWWCVAVALLIFFALAALGLR